MCNDDNKQSENVTLQSSKINVEESEEDKDSFEKDKLSIVDFLLIFVFGICLPSTDVYSDLTVIIKLSGASPHRAMTLACPMILSTLFVLPHWWHLEQSTFKKISTFPFVLLMFYPQYKMIQILYFGLWAKDNKWKKWKDIIERDVTSIGKILYTYTQ